MLKNFSRISQNKMNLRIELKLLEVASTKKGQYSDEELQVQWKRGPQTDCSEPFKLEDDLGKLEKSLERISSFYQDKKTYKW